ncbi:hypothetical protein HPP92_025514 [Vanilla planifolia]|uniref:Uncharacterized protein n=1 Tax=Vanilla planifolia TaxID=51239 RepID=A0A835PI56_VANPL|nr:hypothetical protein HPP92_025514 [Vanilla planifolia]
MACRDEFSDAREALQCMNNKEISVSKCRGDYMKEDANLLEAGRLDHRPCEAT